MKKSKTEIKIAKQQKKNHDRLNSIYWKWRCAQQEQCSMLSLVFDPSNYRVSYVAMRRQKSHQNHEPITTPLADSVSVVLQCMNK